jgi:hypothetical protein
VGEQWEAIDKASGDTLVPTAKGVLVLGSGLAAEWDGTAMQELDFPAGEFSVGAAAGSTVWLAGEDAVLRRESP